MSAFQFTDISQPNSRSFGVDTSPTIYTISNSPYRVDCLRRADQVLSWVYVSAHYRYPASLPAFCPKSVPISLLGVDIVYHQFTILVYTCYYQKYYKYHHNYCFLFYYYMYYNYFYFYVIFIIINIVKLYYHYYYYHNY